MYVFLGSLLLMLFDSQLFAPEPEGTNKLSLANNNFAFKLHMTADSRLDACFSPVSVFTALGMLYVGARGKTAKEIRHALSYDTAKINDVTLNQQFQQLFLSLGDNSDDEGRLEIANAIISQADYPILQEYKETLDNYYNAVVKEVDFKTQSEEAISEINNWVSSKTHGKIPTLLESLDTDTVLVLLNAVYFKGKWKLPFNPRFSKKEIFYNDGIEAVSVQMMIQENHFFHGEFIGYGIEALKIPYIGDKVSMILLLPSQKDGLPSVEKNLTTATLYYIITQLVERNVIVKLPKFIIEDVREIKHNLETLGMRSAFRNDANFKGISTKANLKVSQVIHKVIVEVNEAGTEAAGATALTIVPYMLEETWYFNVDHPFLFYIRDDVNGVILFAGRINHL